MRSELLDPRYSAWRGRCSAPADVAICQQDDSRGRAAYVTPSSGVSQLPLEEDPLRAHGDCLQLKPASTSEDAAAARRSPALGG